MFFLFLFLFVFLVPLVVVCGKTCLERFAKWCFVLPFVELLVCVFGNLFEVCDRHQQFGTRRQFSF